MGSSGGSGGPSSHPAAAQWDLLSRTQRPRSRYRLLAGGWMTVHANETLRQLGTEVRNAREWARRDGREQLRFHCQPDRRRGVPLQTGTAGKWRTSFNGARAITDGTTTFSLSTTNAYLQALRAGRAAARGDGGGGVGRTHVLRRIRIGDADRHPEPVTPAGRHPPPAAVGHRAGGLLQLPAGRRRDHMAQRNAGCPPGVQRGRPERLPAMAKMPATLVYCSVSHFGKGR